METQDLLAYIGNTYGLSVALKSTLAGIKLEKQYLTGITALVNTIEQNLYNINVEVEELLNMH